jgi:two-component system sensor histidine kinase AtoS
MKGHLPVQLTDTKISASSPGRVALRDRGLWFVLLTLAGTTLLHYLTDIHLIPYHSIYRSLYYVPIAVAAVRFGRRGGALTALAACLLYIPHILLSWEVMATDGFNDLLETLIFLFVGVFAGSLADAERQQRKRAQEAARQLAAANEALQTQATIAERMRAEVTSILESVDSGVITLDRHQRVISANPAARELLGEASDIGGPAPAPLREYLTSPTGSYHQLTINDRAIGLHGAPLAGADGEAAGTVLVLDDLSERRALEEQIQRAQRLAALGRLAGGLAHEIRNPLGITRAAAQMLQRELEANTQLREYTQVIQTEIDRVDRLIEQLLAYARPVPVQRGRVEVNALLDRTFTLTRAYAAHHSVTLVSDAEANLPLVEGDAELLHQALVNLLLNSIHATAPDGTVHVRAHPATTGPHHVPAVELEISDTGHGIAPDDLPHIFDPFFTTRVDGTGLGLSIVQQIVQEHGGTIEVQSLLGSGTRFVLSLPAVGR